MAALLMRVAGFYLTSCSVCARVGTTESQQIVRLSRPRALGAGL